MVAIYIKRFLVLISINIKFSNRSVTGRLSDENSRYLLSMILIKVITTIYNLCKLVLSILLNTTKFAYYDKTLK